MSSRGLGVAAAEAVRAARPHDSVFVTHQVEAKVEEGGDEGADAFGMAKAPGSGEARGLPAPGATRKALCDLRQDEQPLLISPSGDRHRRLVSRVGSLGGAN